MTDVGFEAGRRRLKYVRRRYVELLVRPFPIPGEFHEAARQKYSHLPDLSTNTKLDDLREPQGVKLAEGIGDCAEWLDIAIAFYEVVEVELLAGHPGAAKGTASLGTIAEMEAVA